MTDEYPTRVSASELRSFVERLERPEEDKREISEQLKEVMTEAKDSGYDAKIIRKLLALRKRDRAEVEAEETVFDTYRQALGC